MAKPKDRSAKLAKFVEVYLTTQNATQAAIAAGYSKNGAAVTGSRLLRTANVKQIISEHASKAIEKIDISAERVLSEIFEVGMTKTKITGASKVAALGKLMEHFGLIKPQNDKAESQFNLVINLGGSAPAGEGCAINVNTQQKLPEVNL